jgi:hypothetical protein
MDMNRSDGERPALAWKAPKLLQITVPINATIGLKTDRYEDIGIRVVFSPNDPAVRARFLEHFRLRLCGFDLKRHDFSPNCQAAFFAPAPSMHRTYQKGAAMKRHSPNSAYEER